MAHNDQQGGFRADQTIVRPTPGGRTPTPATAPAPATDTSSFSAQPSVAHQPSAIPDIGSNTFHTSNNVMLSASGQIFSLLKALRNLPSPPSEVSVIRHQFVQLIGHFETQLQQAGVDQDTLVYARYGLCCTVDEIILNTPWGGHSIWSTSSLLSTYHRETRGGEHFFTILDKALKQVAKFRPLLELFYVCLNFGFKGKLRIDPQGEDKHAAIIDRVYQALYQGNPLTQDPLSLKWEGIDTQKRKLGWEFPLWVVFSVGACLVLGYFMYLQNNLHNARTPTLVQLENLLTAAPIIEQSVTTVKFEEPVIMTKPDIEGLFITEIKAGLVAVTTLEQDAKITLWNAFASGSAKTSEQYLPILEKIAFVLQSRPGAIIVTGHTDNIPINSTQYPTNAHLSLGRATAVMQQLRKYPGIDGRIKAEGFGDKHPIVDNSTPGGRARNRRIEIIFLGASQ